jgi:hypothetical protein
MPPSVSVGSLTDTHRKGEGVVNPTEELHYRRIKASADLARAHGIVASYNAGFAYWQEMIIYYNTFIGYIRGCLGEPEPDPPKEFR